MACYVQGLPLPPPAEPLESVSSRMFQRKGTARSKRPVSPIAQTTRTTRDLGHGSLLFSTGGNDGALSPRLGPPVVPFYIFFGRVPLLK